MSYYPHHKRCLLSFLASCKEKGNMLQIVYHLKHKTSRNLKLQAEAEPTKEGNFGYLRLYRYMGYLEIRES